MIRSPNATEYAAKTVIAATNEDLRRALEQAVADGPKR